MEWTPIMKIRFTKETYASKAEAIEAFGHHSWLECDGSFSLFVSLYQAGHIVCAADHVSVDIAVLDLDHLDDAQAGLVHDDTFLDDTCKALGARRIVRCDSASRVYNKQKLFVEVALQRDITAKGNKDRAYVAFRKKFERLTGIQCDPRMDRPAQVTFGISTAPSPTLPPCVPSKQPANDDFVKTPNRKDKVITNADTHLLSPEAGAPEKKTTLIPLNTASYNERYGRRPRSGGRFEWVTDHYIGKYKTAPTVIRAGNRHRTTGKLIKCVVYNLVRQNKDFGQAFTEADAHATLLYVIRTQFENGEFFLAEEGGRLKAQLHMELKRAQLMELDDYYKAVSSEAKNKERYIYTPRTHTAKALFWRNRRFFEQCQDLEAIEAKIGELAQGAVATMQQLWRYYKQFVPHPVIKAKGRPAKGYDSYIASCPRDADGAVLVDKGHLHNMRFRTWCKERGIRLRTCITKSGTQLLV